MSGRILPLTLTSLHLHRPSILVDWLADLSLAAGDFIDRLSEFDKDMNGVVVESGGRKL